MSFRKMKEKFGTGFRNSCIAAVGSAASVSAFAADSGTGILSSEVMTSIEGAGTDAKVVGGLIIAASVVVVIVALVMKTMNRA